MAGLTIVGASERTIWTEWLIRTLEEYGYQEPIWLVNPKYSEVRGRVCYPSVDDLPEIPTIGFLAVGAERAVLECEHLLELGTEEVCIIANGFAESGLAERRELEQELRALCARSPGRVIGPNCVGFARFHESLCALAQPVPAGLRAGDVSVISQSGGLTGGLLGALHGEGLGIDLCYSIGNGAGLGFEAAVEWAISRPTTRMVCGIVEAIRDTERLERVLAEARELGKEIILVTLGLSAGGRQSAASHTGAVIGEQRILRAWLEKHGVLIADSIMEEARLASLVTTLGRPDPNRGVFVITASGGGATLMADTAERHGVPLAQLAEETTTRLRDLLPPGPYVGNPLDVTAGNGPGGVKDVYDLVAADPAVGTLIEPYVLPWPVESEGNRWHRDALERLAESAAAGPASVIVVSVFEQELSEWMGGYARTPGVSVTCGPEETMRALGKLYAAAARATRGALPAAQGVPETNGRVRPPAAGVYGEAEGRAVLAAAGVSVPRGDIATTEDEAASLASSLRAPLVVKVAVPGVGHKGRIGGVKIGLVTDEDVRRAYREVAAGAVEHGVAEAGNVPVLVAEMSFGPELLVGAIRDLVAGPSVTVAVGGWAAESGKTFGTVSLPLDAAESTALTREWGLPHLLGERRSDDFARFLGEFAESFVSGGLSSYTTVEINPVILTPDGVVAADVLLVS